MPNEPENSSLKEKIRARTYPCVERRWPRLDLHGPRETPPPLPGLEILALPDESVAAAAVSRDCNWLQALEGDLDTSHVSFLHAGAIEPEDVEPDTERYYQLVHRNPKFTVVDTDFGAMYGAYRPGGEGKLYWRIAQYLFPFWAQIPRPVDAPLASKAVIPMDDCHSMVFSLRERRPGTGRPSTPAIKRTGRSQIEESPLRPGNSTDWFGRFRLLAQQDNDYLIDREAQRQRVTFTGILGGVAQDQGITESMGPILDRSISIWEHLI